MDWTSVFTPESFAIQGLIKFRIGEARAGHIALKNQAENYDRNRQDAHHLLAESGR
jgi:hypothetical protein